jgi:hypothetical protein
MMFLRMILFSFALIPAPQVFSQSANPIPQWLKEDWTERSANDGTWETDNSLYKNEQETFDAYGLQWKLGLGGNHLTGRLYCIREGNDVGTVWNFTEFWDPLTKQIKIVQIGSDGTVGQGTKWLEADHSIKEQQLFSSPDGGSFETGHRAWMENGDFHTQSFNINNGQWISQRKYIWKRVSQDH